MLTKVINPQITAETRKVRVSPQMEIFLKVLTGPRRSGRSAMYIHGGGGGGSNHTLIERPSRHLVNDGYFDRMLLPDRPGEGASSPMDHPMTIPEHAAVMRAMLDELGEKGPITAMGVSYGGPIALELASIDSRVERVVLIASSPTLRQASGLAGFLARTGLLTMLMKKAVLSQIGKLPPEYPDLDPAYDARKQSDLVKIYTRALQSTPVEYRDSLLFAQQATLDPTNASISGDYKLDVPVIQVIGEGDEVWGTEIPVEYQARFPNWRRYVVPSAKIHKDVFLKPDTYQSVISQALGENLGTV